jgi:cephalosporin hydroxylase
MRLEVDTERGRLAVSEDGGSPVEHDLWSPEGFAALSDLWVAVGWQQKYSYRFSWLGRPVIQLPEDLIRVQEIVVALRPDVIVETGIAHGGSLVFSASLCELLGHGRVVGVDIEIRPHNRRALEEHFLRPRISMIEGGSTDHEVVARVQEEVGDAERVLVILDSNHTKEHVAAELEAYHCFVTPGSWLVAMDGVMRLVAGVPRGEPEWTEDNPSAAAAEFATAHPEFEIVEPPRPFDESEVSGDVTYSPSGWLRRR